MANLGFIGLGIMGSPMAGYLIKGGHRVYLHSRSGVPPDLIDTGGIGCAHASDVPQKSHIAGKAREFRNRSGAAAMMVSP